MATHRYGNITVIAEQRERLYDVTLLINGRIVGPQVLRLDAFVSDFDANERPRGRMTRARMRLLCEAVRDAAAADRGDRLSNLSRGWTR